MLAFNWKFLTPLAFVLLMVTALINALLAGLVRPGSMPRACSSSNIVLGWIALEIDAARYSRGRSSAGEGGARSVTDLRWRAVSDH